MATSLSVDVSALTSLAQRAQQAHAIVENETEQVLDETSGWVLHDARVNLQNVGAIDSHRTLESLDRTVAAWSWDVFSEEPPAIVIEEGRGAGKPMPPPGSINGWLQRHRLAPSLDFVIRRAIGREGTPARPFLVPALDRNERRIEDALETALLRMTMRVFG